MSRTNVQLLAPEQLTNLLPDCLNTKRDSKNKLLQNISVIKKEVTKMQPDVERKKYGQILDFIHEELLLKDSPRHFLVESAILSLKMCPTLKEMKELGVLEEMANNPSY